MGSSPVAMRTGEVDRRASAEPEGALGRRLRKRPLHHFVVPLPRSPCGGGAFLAALLAACSPAEPEPPAAAPTAPAATTSLDCAKGFEALAAEIAALPDFVQAPSPGEPYRFLNHKRGNPSYVITLPEAPAHPAILMQSSAGGAMSNSGCRWGDAKAYEQLVAYIESLRAARR